MANEYVLASDVVSVMEMIHREGYCVGNNEPMRRVFEKLSNCKVVEAERVVHARWEFKSLDQIAPSCSNCGILSIGWYPNCPYCRAKMKNGRMPNE